MEEGKGGKSQQPGVDWVWKSGNQHASTHTHITIQYILYVCTAQGGKAPPKCRIKEEEDDDEAVD